MSFSFFKNFLDIRYISQCMQANNQIKDKKGIYFRPVTWGCQLLMSSSKKHVEGKPPKERSSSFYY